PQEPTEDLVTVPGSHNMAMGCGGNWEPGCTAAALTLGEDGVYTGTFDLPTGEYEYKVAVGGSWEESYGAGAVPNGENVDYTHDGGPITFFYDPVSHDFTSTAQGPIVTLPGSFQKEAGCTGDWQPDCMATWMHDPDGDGTYEWSTAELSTGSYEVKVAHGRSWDENYGAEGVGRHSAHWLDAITIAWPRTLLPEGAEPAGLEWSLQFAVDGAMSVDGGEVTGADGSAALSLAAEQLPQDLAEKYPYPSDYLALDVEGLTTAQVKQVLQGQMRVLQSQEGTPTAFTGVQIPGVLDDLYAGAASDRPLGPTWSADG